MSNLLVISPDTQLYEAIRGAGEGIGGCECRWLARSVPEFEEIADADPSVIVAQLGDSAPSGLFIPQLVEVCAEKSPPIPTIIVADQYQGPVFRDLLKLGARECLTRPLDVRRLRFLIESLSLSARVRPVERVFRTPLEQAKAYSSPAFGIVCEQAERVAGKNTPLLLTGETGVGKTHLARLIHSSSPRVTEPFVSVNCGAIPENLAESELFGHKRGAFTGATDNYEGRFAAAGNGTLLLDEVDSLSPLLQIKLLRVLDERVYEPVGSTQSQKIKARLIAATNCPLEKAVADGTFRQDLFHRLSVIQLQIPPLRERKQEIRMLVVEWIKQHNTGKGKASIDVAEEIWPVLEEYAWPGNIRELGNALEYATTFMQGGTLRPTDLPHFLQNGLPHAPLLFARAENTGIALGNRTFQSEDGLLNARRRGEREELMEVFQNCGFNKTIAARMLGISRAALYKRLQVLGM